MRRILKKVGIFFLALIGIPAILLGLMTLAMMYTVAFSLALAGVLIVALSVQIAINFGD